MGGGWVDSPLFRAIMQAPIELRIELSGSDIPLDLSPGHVTDLLRMTESVGDYVPEGDGSQLSSTLEIPWASHVLGQFLSARYGWDDSAWTIEESGILAAPVYYDPRTQEAQLVKVTRESPAANLDRYWRWLAELKAHCHMLHCCRRGVLHVCHAPRVDQEAILLAYTYEFTPQELISLWDVLLKLRKEYRCPKESL